MFCSFTFSIILGLIPDSQLKHFHYTKPFKTCTTTTSSAPAKYLSYHENYYLLQRDNPFFFFTTVTVQLLLISLASNSTFTTTTITTTILLFLKYLLIPITIINGTVGAEAFPHRAYRGYCYPVICSLETRDSFLRTPS